MPGELATAFAFGLVATLTPCALPLYPGFLAYLAAGSDRLTEPGVVRWLGAAVLAGVLSAMVALGALIAALQVAVGQVLALIRPVADLLVVALGVALALGANPFARLPQLAHQGRVGGPLLSAYLYGVLYGPVALPCSGALLVSMFTLSLTVSSFAQKLFFFLAFGLGFGLPLLALSFAAPARQRALLRAFTARYALVSRLAGILLIAVGLWDLVANWDFVLLYLGH